MNGIGMSRIAQGLDEKLLHRIAENSVLLYRESPHDGREDCEVVYSINPTLRRFLEKAISEDPELKGR
jgi:hypothetical protein